MPQPPSQEQQQDIFLTDLATLNNLYQVSKAFLQRPSITTKTNLQGAIEEAEKTFISQRNLLMQEARKLRLQVCRRRSG